MTMKKGQNLHASLIKDQVLTERNNADIDFNEIVFNLPVSMYTCDKYGVITFYNEATATLWGSRPEVGKDQWYGSWKIYDVNGLPLSLDKYPIAVSLKEAREINEKEIVIEKQDGTRLNILAHHKPLFNSNKEVCGAINILIDISYKKEKEQIIHNSENKNRQVSESLEEMVEERTRTLKLSEERYHKMIEEVRDYAIILLDKDGKILNWNKGAEQIKGYREEEIIGKNFRVFYQDSDRKSKLPEKLINIAIEEGRAMQEGYRVKKNGDKFWGSIVITALHGSNNEIIGFSKVTRDLTERKLAEDKLKQYSRDIEVRNEQLKEFAYVASHDLQEPLRKIQVFSELLENNIDNKEKAGINLEKIKSSAKRMSLLINDVLKYSQLSHSDNLFSPVNLNDVLKNVKEDFELLIEEKCAVIFCDELPIINGIPIQLHQLFSNLLGNALKFSDKNPRITISCIMMQPRDVDDRIKVATENQYYKIAFKDNGPGFSPQYATQIFELFKRLNNKKTGTGIGLPLCKKIVENHNGSISVESDLGKGSIFTVILPA